jgi:hypothetical protein
MSEEKTHILDDPEKKPRIVRALLWMTPVTFALCYGLAWVQGAETKHILLIAFAGSGLCLAAAFVIHVMGSKSWMALVALKVAIVLVGRR